MIDKFDLENSEICSELLSSGRYSEALSNAKLFHNPTHQAPILIDAGFALNKPAEIRLGINLFNELLSSTKGINFAKSSIFYNLANGYYAIYKLKDKKRKIPIPSNDMDLRLAKKNFRKALSELGNQRGALASQVFINFGNCLSSLGRFAEAINFYQLGLEKDPDNGMASGNLGIELARAANITGRYTHEYYSLAYQMLSSTLSKDMHLKFGTQEAYQTFRQHLEYLDEIIRAHKGPMPVPKPIKAFSRIKTINKYVQFCINKGLFMNFWVGNKLLSPGITDDISFGPIATQTKDSELVPEMLRILNEIKESFATARYLYFLSQNKDHFLDEISAMTFYFDYLEYGVNGMYVGLCKAAYARAFDILDKVARIINVYFDLGNRKSSFWKIFTEKKSFGEEHKVFFAARSEIGPFNNPSLIALSDICIDYFDHEQVDFSTIDNRRNMITHDYLAISLFDVENINENFINNEKFSEETLEVLQLAKNAVIYAVSSVNISEAKKSHDNKMGLISYDSIPGQPLY